MDYLKILAEDIHSVSASTVDNEGHPQIRVIDVMHYDEDGLYFLTAKGKEFYSQLIEKQYIAISGLKGKMAITLRGKVRCIGYDKLDLIFEKNPYMKEIYREGPRDALEVFMIYDAEGEFFDITVPSRIIRESFCIGNAEIGKAGYLITDACSLCGLCADACPQSCIDISNRTAVIDFRHCLNCGRCAEHCPKKAIVRIR